MTGSRRSIRPGTSWCVLPFWSAPSIRRVPVPRHPLAHRVRLGQGADDGCPSRRCSEDLDLTGVGSAGYRDRMTDASSSPQPFRSTTSAEAIADLRARLRATRWPDAPADVGWEYGTDPDYLRELVAYWADGFD